MARWRKAVLRSQKAMGGRLFGQLTSAGKPYLTALAVVIGLSTIGFQAQASVPAYVVNNDRGGTIRDRLRQIDTLRSTGQPIEIRGEICYSTCTMLLGLPQTCISPGTVFGFHGPSRSGRQLRSDEFEHYSQLIAQHYPQTLRDWYMKTGRRRIRGVHRIRGTEIIRMGVRACVPVLSMKQNG